MEKTPKVLFLSRGNASRAQIAEGFMRVLAGNRFIPFSAGTESASVSPLAVEVMSEVGIDISVQQPREVHSLFRENFRYAVALFDEPRERHAIFPFTRNLLTWPVTDPEVAASELKARKQVYRQIRDQIRSRVEQLIEMMNQSDRALAKGYATAA